MLARERLQTFENPWEKNTIFNEHPVHKAIIRRDLVSVSEFVFNDGKLGYRDASYPLL